MNIKNIFLITALCISSSMYTDRSKKTQPCLPHAHTKKLMPDDHAEKIELSEQNSHQPSLKDIALGFLLCPKATIHYCGWQTIGATMSGARKIISLVKSERK